VTRAALVCALALSGCAGGGGDERLTVYAAASLTEVFQQLEPDARFNFAGSDELATQLREGADADVYAAASPRYPRELAAEGIVERPVVFATNRLVIIVPDDNPAAIATLGDTARDGVRLVVGGEGVPVGDYTREVLEKAGRLDVLERVVSEEEDVKGIVGKIALGEADAGFVYATDARAASGDVRSIQIPRRFQVPVEYPVAIVRNTEKAAAAHAFVRLLRSQRGRRHLRAAGFGVP
jgi:molybdate transport system substrate-binding protein